MEQTFQSLGGEARAAKLDPAERSEIARKAANARWHKDPPVAVKGAAVPPLPPARYDPAPDDGIREHHGVEALDPGTVRAWEDGSAVVVRVWKSDPVAGGTERRISPAQARYLADQLYRLASRIERRAKK